MAFIFRINSIKKFFLLFSTHLLYFLLFSTFFLHSSPPFFFKGPALFLTNLRIHLFTFSRPPFYSLTETRGESFCATISALHLSQIRGIVYGPPSCSRCPLNTQNRSGLWACMARSDSNIGSRHKTWRRCLPSILLVLRDVPDMFNFSFEVWERVEWQGGGGICLLFLHVRAAGHRF